MATQQADTVPLLQRALDAARDRPLEPRPAGVVRIYDFSAAHDGFREKILAGLALPEKSISWKALFDTEGLQLFERVCAQPEYLAARIERAILNASIGDIVEFAGGNCQFVALGGQGRASTRLLTEHLRPAIFVPVDGSRATLENSIREDAQLFPWLNICGLHANFDAPLHLPRFVGAPVQRKVIAFLGAAFARYAPAAAPRLLAVLRALAGPSGRVLVSVDQTADWQMLEGAYNDKQAAMAAFNVNALGRINSELQADFQVRRFGHVARFDPRAGRLEMGLESHYAQFAHVGGTRIDFAPGERIRTAIHCTYSGEDFHSLAQKAGLRIEKSWSDTHNLFAVHCMVAV
jgi:dimethylhistidine N-methyltransferase